MNLMKGGGKMKKDYLDVIQSYDLTGDGKLYMFDIDEECELEGSGKCIRRTRYDGFETYEDAFNAYQNIKNGNSNKIMSKYVLYFN